MFLIVFYDILLLLLFLLLSLRHKCIIQGVPQLSLLCREIFNPCIDFSLMKEKEKTTFISATSLTLNNEIAIISSRLCSNVLRSTATGRVALGQLVQLCDHRSRKRKCLRWRAESDYYIVMHIFFFL